MQKYVDVKAEQGQLGDLNAAEPKKGKVISLQKLLKFVSQSYLVSLLFLNQALTQGRDSAIELIVDVRDETYLKLENSLCGSIVTSSMGWLAW